MIRTSAARLTGVLVVVCSQTVVIAAENEASNDLLRVGIKPSAPFVMVNQESGQITGFSIDIIYAVAELMRPPRYIEFVVYDQIEEHLDAVRTGEVDLGIAATSFTSDRERTLDFSVPFYRGGLGIAARAEGGGLRFWDVVESSQLPYITLFLFLFLIICANVIWLTERGRVHDTTFDDRWRTGVGQAMWWTIVTMTTVGYGDFVPRNPLSRVISILIIVTGIVLFGMAVGAFSSALTVKQLRTDIRVPSDLRNKPVAVVEDSVAERTLRTFGVEMALKESLKDALTAVDNEEVVAAVHDVALLRYNVPRDYPKLAIVGPTFAEQGYGITFPVNSALRKEVNVALLQLMEGNPPRYRWMLEQWFEVP